MTVFTLSVRKSCAKIETLLDQLEDQLSQSEWLCGSTYSLADIVWTTVLNSLKELKFADFSQGTKRPAIGAYFECLKNRPSFQVAIQSDQMPTVSIIAGLRRIFLGF